MRSIYIGAVIVLAVFGLVAWQFDTTTPAEPAHVETMIAEKTEIALPPAGPSKGVVGIAGFFPNEDDEVRQLLAFNLSDAEKNKLEHAFNEKNKCAEFANFGFDHLNDEYDPKAIDFPIDGYWHLRAYQSGVDEAATWMLAMHHHGAIKIPEDELIRAKAMVKRTIAKPTLQTMDHLGGVFISHRFMPFILHQLKLEPGFYAESDQMVFDHSGHNFKLCLQLKYQAKTGTDSSYDCADLFYRYGSNPLHLAPEIEAETAKFIQAWKKGDYEAAGFEGLAQYVGE
ncbi:MAG: hypothetical protein J0M22_01815 [Gammaproteobacteria bacterium]|nr:hypothetical protein [Gammaproteobacteria bacterium]